MFQRTSAVIASVVLTVLAAAMADPPVDPPPAEPADSPAATTQPAGPAEGAAVEPAEPSTGPYANRPAVEPLTEEQEKELLQSVQRRFPRRYKELMQLRKDNPERYQRVLARMWRWHERWKYLPEEARKAAVQRDEMKIQAYHLVRTWRQTSDRQKKGQIETKLRKVLVEKFNAEQELHEKRLAAMQQEIQALRKENAQREKKRDQIVREQLRRMLLEDAPVGPDDGPDHPGRSGRPRGHRPPRAGPPAPTTQPAEADPVADE